MIKFAFPQFLMKQIFFMNALIFNLFKNYHFVYGNIMC